MTIITGNYLLSFHLDAPARLKKELNSVFTLQSELEAVEKAIETAGKALEKSHVSPRGSLSTILDDLSSTHMLLSEKVDNLFASLRIPETYPSLDGVNLEFIQALLQARDLKANIRKRANESFFEYDRLDQAVGGKANPLGKFANYAIYIWVSEGQQGQNCINTHEKQYQKEHLRC